MTYDYQCARRSATADPDGGARAGTDKSYEDNVLALGHGAVDPPKRWQKTETLITRTPTGCVFALSAFPTTPSAQCHILWWAPDLLIGLTQELWTGWYESSGS